ncbi:MAG TPA: HAD hydrolase-like protein [Candidatus Saccharimonadales bacterium]|nr:HAD hydrolase-like protein [Candidatus Saccharimonadales bacterium]
MVGDRRHDIEAAKAHKINSIGVLWGYGDLRELQTEGATYTVNDTEELRRLLLKKFEVRPLVVVR